MSAPTGVTSPKSNISGYTLKNSMSPELQQIFSKLLGGISGQGLERGLQQQQGLAVGDEDAFGKMEAPAYRAFNKQLGNIGSRFAGANAIDSSAFQNATAGAAQSFAENLGSQRQGIQNNALDRLLGLSDRLMSQGENNSFLEQNDQGFDWGSLLGQLGGAAIGSVGGPIGAGIGKAALPKILKALGLG